MLRTVVLLIIALIFCSCYQTKSIRELQIESGANQLPESKSGLKIDCSPTRGMGLTDSLGSKYGIIHVTNTITNDSTIPILLEIAFPTEFSYPISNAFKIVLWPGLTEPPHLYSDNQEWLRENLADDQLEASNQLNKLLAPGEKYVVTIATIQYPGPPKTCSAVAYTFLQYSERRNYSKCDWTLDQEDSTNSEFLLGIQVGFCTSGLNYESCRIITCGQITYIDD